MDLSVLGKVVAHYLQRIPDIHPRVSLDDWTVMPNHVHAIIIIQADDVVETSHWDVSTTRHHLQSGSLGVIINQYKAACTKRIREMGYSYFAWQPRFYDHIIRNPRSLDRIRLYIWQNPTNWANDENYIESSP
jgi:REP element-mobilizing transposase RayT